MYVFYGVPTIPNTLVLLLPINVSADATIIIIIIIVIIIVIIVGHSRGYNSRSFISHDPHQQCTSR